MFDMRQADVRELRLFCRYLTHKLLTCARNEICDSDIIETILQMFLEQVLVAVDGGWFFLDGGEVDVLDEVTQTHRCMAAYLHHIRRIQVRVCESSLANINLPRVRRAHIRELYRRLLSVDISVAQEPACAPLGFLLVNVAF